MKKQFISVALAGLLALGATTGCKKSPDGGPGSDGRVAVKLKADIDLPSTKVTGDAFETSDRVGLFMKRAGEALTASGALYAECNNLDMKINASALVPATGDLYYPFDGNVDFLAYYPYATPVGAGYTVATNVSNQAMIVETLYSNNVTNQTPTDQAVVLNFNYSLAKIVVTVVEEVGGTSLVQADFDNMSVSVDGMYTEANLQLANGSFTGHQNVAPIVLKKTGVTAAPSLSATFEALILPATVVSGQVAFIFNVGGVDIRHEVNHSYAAATQYNFDFSLDLPAPPTPILGLLNATINPRSVVNDSFTVVTEPVNGVSLDLATLDMLEGEVLPLLTATVSPANAYNKTIRWESDDLGVVTVASNGNGKAILTAVAPGTAKITVTTIDGDLTDECDVTVAAFNPIAEVASAVSFNMLPVAGGTFMMGGTAEQIPDAVADELPVHQVTLNSFYMSETVVTQELWEAVTGLTPWGATWGMGPQVPAYNFNYDGIEPFLLALNTATGKNYRLPTEAEWEFAARGGNQSMGYKYSGSNTAVDVGFINTGNVKPDVAQKLPNELGFYDMSGLCNEYCSDWYGPYTSDPQVNPTGPASGTNKVLRGGNVNQGANFARVSTRNSITPGTTWNNCGVRLVLDVN